MARGRLAQGPLFEEVDQSIRCEAWDHADPAMLRPLVTWPRFKRFPAY
jgi:hypothetical protein